jgi:hypothetical protein
MSERETRELKGHRQLAATLREAAVVNPQDRHKRDAERDKSGERDDDPARGGAFGGAPAAER